MTTASQTTEILSAQLRQMRALIYGNWNTCITYAFAELNLGDLLAQSPQAAPALAQATATDPAALARFLRAAVTLGFVTWQPATETYALTSLGALLTSDHPHSQRAAARLNGADYRYQPWGRLVEVLRTGTCRGISPSADQGSLAYLAARPEDLAVFHRAMTDLSTAENQVLARSYDFGRYAHILDIGCGEGSLIKSILHAYPHVTGAMFDLEQTLAADAAQGEDDFQGRLHRQPGDFFQSVPGGADLYIMKNVIHNWPAARVHLLLHNVRDALAGGQDSPASGPAEPAAAHRRLLIIENLLTNEPSTAAWLDLNFMVLVDGQERTLEEYRDLAAQAGLALLRAIPTATGRHILELALAGQDTAA